MTATPGQAAAPEIPVRLVRLWLCELCLDGKGGECHSPGCALFLNRAPDIGIRSSPMVTFLDAEPKPAPELAAALAEPRELRKVITELLSMFRAISGGYGARTSSSRLRKIAARAGVHWDGLTLTAPDTTEAAETNRLREALENVFAVLDRQQLTYAERISHARTLIRTARDGKS